ncbi:PASTA domain-containing protein [Jatrophihabitans sp. YIM 134969]
MNVRLVVPSVLAVFVLSACGGSSTVVRTVTATAPTSANSVASAASSSTSAPPPRTSSTPPPPAATTTDPVPSVPESATRFTMPNEVGKGLQTAQDDIQSVSGNPVYFTTSTDATGAGRFQVLDRDWQVCSQSVPPGSTVADGEPIDFGVVKLNERCP